MNRTASVPAHELAESHFARSSVWQFNLGLEHRRGIDESHAVPAPHGLRLGTHGSFIVHARYLLSNGRELPGAVQVNILGRRVLCTPVAVYAGGKSLDPFAPDLEAQLSRIAKQPKARPVKWTLNASIAGDRRVRNGRIRKSRLLAVLGLVAQLIWIRFMSKAKASASG